MDNYILESNLQDALKLAIENLRTREERISATYKSGGRAALEENLRLLQLGYRLEIRYGD